MHDPFLKTLNAAVNSHELSFGITLVVNGGVITGSLICAKSFFNEFAESVSQAWPTGPDEGLRASFAQWGQPEGAKLHEEFLHLKGARYVSGKDIVPTDIGGMLWRGRLDSVSGFSLGAFNQN